jgi:hypothetical protein
VAGKEAVAATTKGSSCSVAAVTAVIIVAQLGITMTVTFLQRSSLGAARNRFMRHCMFLTLS